MPELPEVETIKRGLTPHLIDQRVSAIVVRERKLRFLVPAEIQNLCGQIIKEIVRRGKYLLFITKAGTAIIHLGMSGRLYLNTKSQAFGKHDHLDICFENQSYLRFHDTRKFGAVLWTAQNANLHPLLAGLGPEPFTEEFNPEYLWQKGRRSSRNIKTFIMDSQVVAGVGNIYANEALFLAGIHPQRSVNSLTKIQMEKLVTAIEAVLLKAIQAGGTTLRDYRNSSGKPGYFQQELLVYGKEHKPCSQCQTPLNLLRLSQRSTVYCPQCQI